MRRKDREVQNKTEVFDILKRCDTIRIGIPGIKDEYAGRSEELLTEWLGNEAYMFKSTSEWKEIIGNHDRIEMVEVWEMEVLTLHGMSGLKRITNML